ncbi:MAG: hypothetical protein Q8O19_04450 [Rectinemataceae bacterium]|nr:hypothetical protein [Rectinemataceae bacterium]
MATFTTGTVIGSQTFTTNNIADSGALTIASGGTGTLTLDPTGAGAIVIGSADVTSISFTTDNNVAGDFTFAGGATFNDEVTLTLAGTEFLSVTNTTQGASDLVTFAPTWTVDSTGDALQITTTYNVNTVTGIQYGLNVVNADNAASTGVINALALFSNDQATDTLDDGVIVRHNAASGILTDALQIENTTAGGTITNGINILETAGTITNGIVFSSAFAVGINAGSNTIENIGNAGTDFIASTGALTLAGVLTANGGISLSASQSIAAVALAYVDLGLITHGTIANQGLRLPNAASATPSNPTSGEGYLAWDAAGNQLITYNGTAWATLAGGSGYNLIKDETVSLTARTTLAFLGAGVSCADNVTQTECTIAGGGSSDLQATYGADVDGGNATIALTTADDSIVISNPASAGTDSAFVLKVDQLAAGAVDGLQIANAGTGAGLAVNATSTGNLIQLQKSGTNKFVVANNGGLAIFGATTNITKTSTGTTGANDFSITGSTLTNVTSQNDEIDIDSGTVVTTFTSATATTANAIGVGGHSIVRDDGSVMVVSGGNLGLAATGSLWDGVSGTMTTKTIAAGATFPGAGAISLKRPDGKYLLVHGNATALTSVYDPWGITAAVAGPAICAGATAGTNAFMRGDGKYVILCGGTTLWGIYDPTANTYVAGSAVATGFGAGAHAIARDDGTFIVFAGGGVSTHYLYTPSGTTATAGVMSAANPITTNAPTVSTGAFSIRRNDGKYLVVGGAINISTVYNPTPTSSNGGAGSFELINGGTPAAGFGPITTALGDAAQAVRRQDGKYLMVHGGASTLTDIIDLSVTTSSMFTAGTALNVAMGAGGHFVPRPNGKYQIIRGGGTNSDTYDMGFIIGGNGTSPQLASYETECITVTSLNASSTLNWNTNAEGAMTFQVKTGTGSCSSSYRDVPSSGGLVGGASGNDRVQVKVFFKRPFFIGYDQEWALWRGLSQPRYRAKKADPTLYDITINNSSQVYRSQFDFGIGSNGNATASDPSGPVVSNINITTDKTAQLAMTNVGNQSLASTVTAIGATYNGAVGTHQVLATAATEGTVVIKRPNGTFLVVSGNSATSNAQIYTQETQAFATNATGVSGAVCSGTGNGSCLPTTGAANTVLGRGALAFKRPDGKFLVVLGGATTTTNIYDPVLSTFTLGPVTTGVVGRGALVIPLPNGRVLIAHGNQLTTTSVYDPVNNVMIAGPETTVFVGPGSLAIPNTNGTWFIALGVAAVAESATAYTCSTIRTTTNLFDPYAMAFTATTGQPAMTTGIGPGAFAFQRSDGMWMINKGGNVVTTCAAASATAAYQLYNPVTMKLAVGPSSVVGSLSGAHAVQRPNGSWLIFNGGSTTTTQIYLENDGAASALAGGAKLGSFTAGPTVAGVGSGAVSFQRDDGKYVMISGGTGTSAVAVGTAATAAQQYDAGWITSGSYRSEQLNVTDLDANSTLSWRASPDMKGISAEVRTASSQLGLQTVSSRDVPSSGGLINGSSDTWLQVQFNFKRTFPTMSNIWTDTWWNGGSTNAHTWRNIINPTLNEFSVNKDVNLVDLKSDGLSVFRVSTNGDIYTSNTGSVRTGGADLAENYTSKEPLLPGEVVALDSLSNHGVKKATYQYQRDVLGVVSTAPGFVAGSYTKDSYPIALVGRVPVKVSNENGPIHAGDMLTAASIPGYAMRAVLAGRVIGTAMENLDEAKLVDCPASEFIIAGRQCGEVMMFVNLVNSMGSPIDMIMAEKNAGTSTEGLSTETEATDGTNGLVSSESIRLVMNAPSKQEQVLSFLKKLRDERAQNSAAASEIFTDRIAASTEIITPTLVVDRIFAKSIKADSIEGLQIWTDQLSSLSEKYAGLEAATSVPNTDVSSTQAVTEQKALAIAMKNLSADTITVQLDGSILGKLTVAGAIRIGGDAQFDGDTIFAKLATFLSDTVFKGKAIFEKAPTFGSNTAGFAIIAEGQQSVEVTFDEAYAKQPIVSISITSDRSPLLDGADKDLKNDIQTVEADFVAAYFDGDIKYIVTKKSKQGFTIVLNKPAPRELQWSWIAIAVNDAKVSRSKEDASPVVETAPATVPLEIPTIVPAPDAVENDSPDTSEIQPIVEQDTPSAEAHPEDGSSTTNALEQLTNTLGQLATP